MDLGYAEDEGGVERGYQVQDGGRYAAGEASEQPMVGGEGGGEGHAAVGGEQDFAQGGGDHGGGGVAAGGFEGEGEGDFGAPSSPGGSNAEAERVERETRWAAKERERLARPNVASSLKARFEEGTFEEEEEGADYAQGHQGAEEQVTLTLTPTPTPTLTLTPTPTLTLTPILTRGATRRTSPSARAPRAPACSTSTFRTSPSA